MAVSSLFAKITLLKKPANFWTHLTLGEPDVQGQNPGRNSIQPTPLSLFWLLGKFGELRGWKFGCA